MTLDEIDAKGLIRESYRIDGIGADQCRSIFLDWAISLPAGCDTGQALKLLLSEYGVEGHPMTEVLTDGLAEPQRRGRRGGRAARHGGAD